MPQKSTGARLTRYLSVSVLLAGILLLMKCGEFSTEVVQTIPPTPPPKPALEILTANPVFPGDSVQIAASINPPDAGSEDISFQWSLLEQRDAVLSSSSGEQIVFVAKRPGEFVVSARSVQGTLLSEIGIKSVLVDERQDPEAPVAIATVSDSMPILGTSVLLNGSQSYDPQADPFILEWHARNGGILTTKSDTTVEFSANNAGTYSVTLQATDSSGNKSNLAFTRITYLAGTAPTINIAPYDSIVNVGDIVELNASSSLDPDGHGISFQWAPLTVGAIADVDTGIVTFQTNQRGAAVILLTVTDDFGISSSKQINIQFGSVSPDFVPIACLINSSITTQRSLPVVLDGSCSIDAGGLPVLFVWQDINGGTILPVDSTRVQFSAETSGDYLVSLTVRNDSASSIPVFAQITVEANTLPEANAGNDALTKPDTAVTLDGSLSSDQDGDSLSFYWSTLNGGTLVDSLSITPAFSAAEPGTYTIMLVVNDGTDNSPPDFVIIFVEMNRRPMANAGNNSTTFVNVPVMLDGTGSDDPDGNNAALEFFWESYSGGILMDSLSATPTFVAATEGIYPIALRVFDSQDTSFTSIVTVTVVDTNITSPVLPIARAGADQDFFFDGSDTNLVVTLDGSASYDPGGNAILEYRWQGVVTNRAPYDTSFVRNGVSTTFSLPNVGTRSVFLLGVFNGTLWSFPDQIVVSVTGPDRIVSKRLPLGGIVVSTIGEAVAAFPAESLAFSIYIEPDTIYNETVTINRNNMTLFSTNPATAIVQADGFNPAFLIDGAQNITLRGLSVTMAGTISSATGSITLRNNANDATIDNCLVVNNLGDGVLLDNVLNTTILNSEISSNNQNGICATNSNFSLFDSRVVNNTLSNIPLQAAIAVEGITPSNPTILIKQTEFLVDTTSSGNHIKLFNDVFIHIENSSFRLGGEAIFADTISQANIEVESCSFKNMSGSSIFVNNNNQLNVANSFFVETDSGSASAMDLISISGNVINSHITGFQNGIKLFNSDVTVSTNTFERNTIGIFIDGEAICPTIEMNNMFIKNGTNCFSISPLCNCQ